MMYAQEARRNTVRLKTLNKIHAQELIEMFPSDGWEYLNGEIKKSDSFSTMLMQKDIEKWFGDNGHWTVDKIREALGWLGYTVKGSYSTNEINETWTIGWKGDDDTD